MPKIYIYISCRRSENGLWPRAHSNLSLLCSRLLNSKYLSLNKSWFSKTQGPRVKFHLKVKLALVWQARILIASHAVNQTGTESGVTAWQEWQLRQETFNLAVQLYNHLVSLCQAPRTGFCNIKTPGIIQVNGASILQLLLVGCGEVNWIAEPLCRQMLTL